MWWYPELKILFMTKELTIPTLDQVKTSVMPFAMSALVKSMFAPLERYRIIRQTQDLLTLFEKERVTSFWSFVRSTQYDPMVKRSPLNRVTEHYGRAI
jgi:hypothetical protein